MLFPSNSGVFIRSSRGFIRFSYLGLKAKAKVPGVRAKGPRCLHNAEVWMVVIIPP